jgi:hypothetical protein
MNHPRHFIRHSLFAAILAISVTAHAQVPQLIHYQSRVAVGTVNFEGSGQFKFALVNTNGSSTYWSNDGSSVAGSEPTAAVTLPVSKGLYTVHLGDTTLANMTAIPASVFTNADVRLRVWFNDGPNGSQMLTPDHRIAAVGYAMMAGTVADGSITSAKIANGAIGSTQLASGAVGATQLASGAVGAAQLADGTITAAKMADGAITPDKLAKPVRTGSVPSSSMAMDPTGAVFTVPFNPVFGAVPNVMLTMDAADGGLPSKAKLTLTGRTVGQFTARVSPGTSDPLTSMTPIDVDTGGNYSGKASLVVVNGNPASSCYDSSNGDLKYVRAADPNGATWNTPVTVDAFGGFDVGGHNSLAIVNGNPAIAYLDNTNQNLKYVRASDANGTSWGAPLIVDAPGNTGEHPSLSVVNGNPAICYCDTSNGKLRYARATDSNGTSWGAPVDLDNANSSPITLLVVNGKPAVSYRKSVNQGWYVRSNDVSGTSWGTPVNVYIGTGGAMAIVNGRPAICSYGYSSYVRANDADGTSWGTPVQLPGTANSLAVINGYPAIFGDGVYMRSLNADGTVWSNFVSVTGNASGVTSLTLINGQPAMISTSPGDLKFIRAGASQPFNVLWMALEP